MAEDKTQEIFAEVKEIIVELLGVDEDAQSITTVGEAVKYIQERMQTGDK